MKTRKVCLSLVFCLLFDWEFMRSQVIERDLNKLVDAVPAPVEDTRSSYTEYQQFCLSAKKTDIVLERLRVSKALLGKIPKFAPYSQNISMEIDS